MKVAVVGSKELVVINLQKYIPDGATEIVCGSSKKLDQALFKYASEKGLGFTEMAPDYHTFGRRAPIKQRYDVISAADEVVVFWDGVSQSMKLVIDHCNRVKVPVTVHLLSARNDDIRIIHRPLFNK